MKSKIIIEGMHFKAYHGYYLEEQKIGGQYRIDLEIEYDIIEAARKDDLEKTINYEMLYQICKEEMKTSRKLIESVGLAIMEKIKEMLTHPGHIVVEIHKINPPIDGLMDRAIIRIES